ncbi:MAG: hypothetical protein ACTSXD_14490 [Candidatus Heimdallarchaeaceae archaeon]
MKLWNYMFTITGLSVILALAGLDVAGISDLFRIIGLIPNPTGIGLGTMQVGGTLWDRLFSTEGILIASAASSIIVIGTFITNRDKSYIILPIITGVSVYWGSVIVSLIQLKGSYDVFGTILAVIFIALSVGFVQSCVDYFMGVN